MSDRVLVPLATGQWLALSPEVFAEALQAGRKALAAAGAAGAGEASDTEPLLETEELAAVMKLPPTWIEQKAREGVIPSVQAGRWRRFRRSAVETALAANGKHA